MFGGIGIYRDGLMFGLVAGDEIYLKTDAETLPAFQKAGSRPFAFERDGRPTQTSYWLIPEEALDDPDGFRTWATLGYDAALRAQSAKPKKTSRKPAA